MPLPLHRKISCERRNVLERLFKEGSKSMPEISLYAGVPIQQSKSLLLSMARRGELPKNNPLFIQITKRQALRKRTKR